MGAWVAFVWVHWRDRKEGRERVAVWVRACAGEKGTTAGQWR